jgi:hypothetical protein
MSIPANGPVSFSQLRAAFGTGNSGPISMSSYYNNAPAAFTTGVPGVPASGNTISMSKRKEKTTSLAAGDVG